MHQIGFFTYWMLLLNVNLTTTQAHKMGRFTKSYLWMTISPLIASAAAQMFPSCVIVTLWTADFLKLNAGLSGYLLFPLSWSYTYINYKNTRDFVVVTPSRVTGAPYSKGSSIKDVRKFLLIFYPPPPLSHVSEFSDPLPRTSAFFFEKSTS